ncbi:MAG TPA: 30S ribosomal protein S8 [Clostridiales bacterium]|nr:30S ribosomal protein S8 [Clostridiales bacterium]
MVVTDPIADMLTRIRNALTSKHADVKIPASKVKSAIADILLEEGYIESVEKVEDGVNSYLNITLKYGSGKSVINGLKRVSKPGLRVYANCEELPKVLGGLGIAIISTSKGIMTDKKARLANVGGEVMAYVW